MEKVRTAVVGCGMISNIYIKNLKNLFSIIELAAVGDINRAAAEEKARTYGIERVMTIDEIAASPDIELVINLTPAFVHYSVIRQMLEAGKHVWTEKVMTVTVEEARDLCALADKKGLFLGAAPDTVLGAGLQTARQALDTGMIGTVTSGLAVIDRDQCLNSEVFTFLKGSGGTLPYDVGIYYIGALVSVLFDGNTVNVSQHTLTLFGTQGVLRIGDPDTFGGANTLLYPDQAPCVLPFTHGYDGRNTVEPSPYDHYGHRGVGAAEMAYAIRQVRPNRCSKEYGLHCLEVLDGMERSAATGETVELNTRFTMAPLAPGYYSSFLGGMRADAEGSLVNG